MSEDEKKEETGTSPGIPPEKPTEPTVKVRKKTVVDLLIDRASTSTADMIRYTIVPGIKDLAHDSLVGIVDGMFDRGRSSRAAIRRREDVARRGVSREKVVEKVDYSYNGITNRPTTRVISDVGRRNHDFTEIIFESRVEAEDSLDKLRARLEKYGTASVADLYSITGIDDNFKDNEWGWDNLDGSYVRRYRRGFVLDLPETKKLI